MEVKVTFNPPIITDKNVVWYSLKTGKRVKENYNFKKRLKKRIPRKLKIIKKHKPLTSTIITYIGKDGYLYNIDGTLFTT